jgi:hypothetical protein
VPGSRNGGRCNIVDVVVASGKVTHGRPRRPMVSWRPSSVGRHGEVLSPGRPSGRQSGGNGCRDDGVVVEMKKEVHGRWELDGRIVKTYDLVKTSNMSGRLMT